MLFLTHSSKNKLLFDINGHKLIIGLCQTKWAKFYDGVIQFQKILSQLVIVLTKIIIWKESSVTTSKAKNFILSICGKDFIIILFILLF